jgi:hypothetical protein
VGTFRAAGFDHKRAAATPATWPWLDLQIDSRIFARWLLVQTDASKPQSSEQIAGYLHGTSMLNVLPLIDDFASKQTDGPNSVQTIGMGRIHQLSFTLKDAKDIAALDAGAAEVAQDILIAVTPMKGGDQLPALVPMRPASATTTATAQGSSTNQPRPKTADDLASLARQASVSAPLREQLITMAAAAKQAESDTAHPDEAEILRDELENSLDVAAGLQSNTAVTADERSQIESQLCAGLALFCDPRMREAGQTRLAALDQYRQLLGRIAKMRVPPELKDALSPALSWAHENPDQGDKVLSCVEQFVALYLRHEAKSAQPEQFASLRLADPLRRAYEEVGKQFVKSRGDFLGDSAGLSGDGGGTAGGTPADGAKDATGNVVKKDDLINTGSGPDSLKDSVDQMAQLEDLQDVLAGMPKTIATLDAFKARPIGGIQRHVNVLLVTVDSPIKSPSRDEATKQLFQLHELAKLADELLNVPQAAVPPAVAQAYTGDEIEPLQTKCKSVITDLASLFGSNQPIDSDKLNSLKSVHHLFDALRPAAEMEAAFAKPDGLANWADWSLTPEQVHALVQPYQQAMAQAFGGFIADNPDPLSDFSKMRPVYEPMMALFTHTGSYADACSTLPQGTVGMLAKLATPYDKAPFGKQRFASFVAAMCASAAGDASVDQAAAAAISDHVRQ